MSAEERRQRTSDAVSKLEDIDIGAIVVKTSTNFVKNRPIFSATWVLGLIVAAFASGFNVSEERKEIYSITLSQAQEVDRKDLTKALNNLQKAEDLYYQNKGWFWSCDARCQKFKDKADMARAEVERVQAHRDAIMKEARQEVGIWSVYGVQDVRNAFWGAWKSGKDWAARYTMYDAFFMMMGSSREESAVAMIMKLVMQYIVNLTMGLIGAFFFFVYSVYGLICSYGEPTLSGVAFFLLVLVSGIATVGTYLIAIYGTVAGGGVFLVKQAAKQAAMQDGRQGGQPRRVQYQNYGGGYPGGRPRTHYD